MAGRILIADTVATNRIVLKVKLSAARYEVVQAGAGASVLEKVKQTRPDLLLIENELPDMSAPEVCRRLRADPETADLPVIVMTRQASANGTVAALAAGADELMAKPLDELTLLARVRSLMRAAKSSEELRRRRQTAEELGFAEAGAGFQRAGRVALVAESSAAAVRWKSGLARHLPDRLSVMTAEEALSDGEAAADLFVIAADLFRPGDGLRLLSELRSRSHTRHAAVLVVHPRHDTGAAVMALDLGANDLVPHDAAPEEMALRIRTHLRRKLEADHLRDTVEAGLKLAVTDPLTGLFNRRYALTHVRQIARRAEQSGEPYAVMVLDLDRFKRINDAHGHAAGDAVLIAVAERVRDNLRACDMVARLGGEEFLVAMPGTDLRAARCAAERICGIVAATPVEIEGAPPVTVTLSIGVAIGRGARAGEAIEALIARADRALYDAKSFGRNQVTISRSAA